MKRQEGERRRSRGDMGVKRGLGPGPSSCSDPEVVTTP